MEIAGGAETGQALDGSVTVAGAKQSPILSALFRMSQDSELLGAVEFIKGNFNSIVTELTRGQKKAQYIVVKLFVTTPRRTGSCRVKKKKKVKSYK